MRDPFTPDKGRFLVVGSRCSICGRLVCVGPVGKPRAPWAASSPPRGWDLTSALGRGDPRAFPRGSVSGSLSWPWCSWAPSRSLGGGSCSASSWVGLCSQQRAQGQAGWGQFEGLSGG